MSALITVDPGNKDMKTMVGKGLLFFLVCAFGYGLYTIMPKLIEFAENVWYLAGMVAAAVLLVYWLMSGGWRAIKYFVYGLGQATLGKVIEMNPFNILEYRLEKTEEATQDLLKYKEKLQSKGAELKDKIDSADAELKKSVEQKDILSRRMASGTATDNDSDNLEMAIQTMTSSKEYIDGIQPVYQDLLRLLDFTDRAYRTANLELKKSKKDLSMKRDLFETVTTSASMVKKAWAALIGDETLNSDADKAIEALKKDIGAKIGAIKTGIKITGTYMDGKDLENAAKLQTTLKQLKDINLDTTSYSATLNSDATKAELKGMKGGANTYMQFLDIPKKDDTSNK